MLVVNTLNAGSFISALILEIQYWGGADSFMLCRVANCQRFVLVMAVWCGTFHTPLLIFSYKCSLIVLVFFLKSVIVKY